MQGKPIKKVVVERTTPAQRPISKTVLDAAREGVPQATLNPGVSPRSIVAASQSGAEDYRGIVPPGLQVMQGVAGSMVPGRSNAIKAIWAENNALQNSDPNQPQRIMPTGMIGEVGRRYSNTPAQDSERLHDFRPEYESTRIPGVPFDGRMVDRVDVTPETQQFYVGKSPEDIGQLAQTAYFNTQIDKGSWNKSPSPITPGQAAMINQSFAADGIDPRAYAVRPGGIQTYQSPDPRGLTFSEYSDTSTPDPRGITPSVQDAQAASGSRGTSLGPIPAYKGQEFKGVGTNSFQPGAPALPGRPDRWFQRSNRTDRGQRVIDDRSNSLLGNYPENQQAEMLRQNPNALIAGFAHDVGGPDGGMSGFEIVGSANSYAMPKPVVNYGKNGQIIPNEYEPAINAGAALDKDGNLAKGQTVGGLMYDVNEDFANGANIGSGLKREFQAGEFSPEDIVNLVTEAQSVGDLIDSGYTSGTGDNKIAKMLREDRNRGGISRDNPKGLSTLQDALDAEAFAKSASPRIEFPATRTVDPRTGREVPSTINRYLKSVGGYVDEETGNAYTVDPNAPDAMYGSRATRQATDERYRNELLNEPDPRSIYGPQERVSENPRNNTVVESPFKAAGTRNPESRNWGLKPDEEEELVPYSGGSLGRARIANGSAGMANDQAVAAIKMDPAVQSETLNWIAENYPDVARNMQGARSFSSMGVDQSTHELPSGMSSYDELIPHKDLSPTLQSFLIRNDGSNDGDVLGLSFKAQPSSIGLPGLHPGDTGRDQIGINSSVPVPGSQMPDGQRGYADNFAGSDPVAIGRQQTMFNPVTKQREVVELTDTAGVTPWEHANQARARANQQQMALKQSLNEFYRGGGVIKDEFGRPTAPHMEATRFDGENLHDSYLAQDAALGLPPRDDAYAIATRTYDQTSPNERGGGIDPVILQLPERLALQGSATKAAEVRRDEIRSMVDELETGTAIDNRTRDNVAISFIGPDRKARTSVQPIATGDQMRIQRYLKQAAGLGELQAQYVGMDADPSEGGRPQFLQGPRMQDPTESLRPWASQMNQGKINQDDYNVISEDVVRQYVEQQAADPYVKSFRAASPPQPRQYDDNLPSAEQIAYGSPGVMPESMTTRPNIMTREARSPFIENGVVRDPVAYTPYENQMRQVPQDQQVPLSRDMVNPVVQSNVKEDRRLGNKYVAPRRARSQSDQDVNLASMADAAMGMTPQQRQQSIIDAAEAEAGAAQRRRDLELVGRYQQ